MADSEEHPSALLLSLQTQCLTRILHHLDDYPTGLLSLLPTRQRKELMMSLPPLDICKLEDSDVVNGVDMNEVWQVVCELYHDTDNIRVTGNSHFDNRYLNYRHKAEPTGNIFFDCDAKVKGDWRAHFITRTGQILLHSFDPSNLSLALAHSDHCDCANDPEQDCDCWGCGLDPTHQVFLQRLMSVPPHSNIAKWFSELEQRSLHFKEVKSMEAGGRHLLIPFRYAKYFDVNYKAAVLDLLMLFVKKCHFQPRILPVHCEFMFHSEFYQLHLRGEDASCYDAARSLFVEFLAKLEQIEFYWVGGMKGTNVDGQMTYEANPSIHIPKLFLEAILSNPSTMLDTICFKMYSADIHFSYMPNLDSCLHDISAFFSTPHPSVTEGTALPISTPYKGLKRIHVFGAIGDVEAGEIIPSIILHQTAIEGLEIRCVSKSLSPLCILDPIAIIFSQSQLQFFVFNRWKFAVGADYLKDIFYQFLNANHSHEIKASTLGHEIVIPALTQDVTASPHTKVLRFFSRVSDTSHLGVFFAWLREADINVPLRSVRISSLLCGYSGECLLSHLSTCGALTFDIKGGFQMPSEYFNRISKNKNLQVLRINNCTSFVSLADNFCTMLNSVYANSTNLKEVSFQNNNIHNLPGDKLKHFFEVLLSFSYLEKLSVDLRWNLLRDRELDVLLKVWKNVAMGKKLKSLALDSSSYKDQVTEMVLE